MGGDALGKDDLQLSRAALPRRAPCSGFSAWLASSMPSPVQRLAAVDRMVGWGDRAVVPLLQRALRDPHPEVVVAAAAAIARFRGRSAAAAPAVVLSPSAARRPRNASPRLQSV
jgi:HEAT repeat protein